MASVSVFSVKFIDTNKKRKGDKSMKKRMMCLRGSVLVGLVFLFAMGLAGTFLTDEVIAQIRPALVQDVENPAQNPFLAYGYQTSNQGILNFWVSLNPEVPVGKRLAIEFVTISCTSSNTDDLYKTNLWINKKESGGGMSSHGMAIILNRQGTASDGKATWTTSQPVKLYSDGISGMKIQLEVYHKNYSEPSGSCLCVAKVVGGTVNAP